MEFKKLIKYFFICASVCFTAICAVLLTILAIITSENTNFGIEPARFLLVLAFCFVIALGNTVRRIPSVSLSLGWIINAICYVGGFIGFLLAFKFEFATAIIITVVFACIYTPIAIFKAFKEKKQRGSSLSLKNKTEAPKNSKATSNNKKESTQTKNNDTPYQNLFS